MPNTSQAGQRRTHHGDAGAAGGVAGDLGDAVDDRGGPRPGGTGAGPPSDEPAGAGRQGHVRRGTSAVVRARSTAGPCRPYPLGVTLRSGGIDVAVFAEHAEAVEICLIDDPPGADAGHGAGQAGAEHRVLLPERTHGVWHGHVPDVGPGRRYGLRAHGPWDPARGHRYNPNKLLLDPYTRAVSGELHHRPEVFAHRVDAELRGDRAELDGRDSAPFVPHGVVVDDGFDWGDDEPPRVPWSDTVIYEAHVRGLTKLLPGVPEELRGTYAGLAHPATLEHLLALGVTTLELLPVHAMGSETGLVRRGRINYWGYNTLAFFAPNPRYASEGARRAGPLAVLAEIKGMVRLLHQAGLEVVLDVVYNHTCEAGPDGPCLSWRGLDDVSYYRHEPNGRYVDYTGCGNSLDFSHPRVVQLTLDSLRYWVSQVHVDGFRFDLAPTLARGWDAFSPDHPFLVAARTDPVLADVKLIAEPWDLGPHGWRTGQFPPPFVDWNDRFRDAVRTFWLSDAARVHRGWTAGGVRELATRLAGSADTFDAARGPLAGVNFVAAHDGFTLADLVAYNEKHNEANGEDNRDGSNDNRSWNHGVEGWPPVAALPQARGALAGPATAHALGAEPEEGGPAEDGPTEDGLAERRRRSVRNLLGSLLIATGVPMLTAGDEMGRSQGGNNNAYCLDDPTTWVDWDLADWQRDMLATTAHLLALRREHAVLRQGRFFAGRPVHPDSTKDLAWFDADGYEMDVDRWHDPHRRTLQMFLHGAPVDGASLLVVVHGGAQPGRVQLPGPPWASRFEPLWHSAWVRPPDCGGDTDDGSDVARALLEAATTVEMPPLTMLVLLVHRP